VNGSDIDQFKRPYGITISEDLVYVVDRENKRVQVFDRTGKYLFQFNSNFFIGDVCILHENAYVTSLMSWTVQVFQLE